MKIKLFILFIIIANCINASAQKIQYSKSVIKVPGKGEIQLLANIDGFHHLIYLANGNKPVLYIFNDELQLHSRTELNIRFPEKAISGYYSSTIVIFYIYIHTNQIIIN